MISPFEATEPISRKVLPIFFLIDISAGITRERISNLNKKLNELILEIKSNSKTTDYQIKVAVLEFSDYCRWHETKLVNIEDFEKFEDFETAGTADISKALSELDKKLSGSGYMQSKTGIFPPNILIFLGGNITGDYKASIERLWKNRWFNEAVKIAVSMDRNTDEILLAEITGSSELVWNYDMYDCFFTRHIYELIKQPRIIYS